LCTKRTFSDVGNSDAIDGKPDMSLNADFGRADMAARPAMDCANGISPSEVTGLCCNWSVANYAFKEFSDVGGLFIYGADLSVLFERAADYLDRLLRGEKPGNLPVQQAVIFELVINLKAAAALGLTIPANVLIRANEVIE
jgi:hypothetical protein